MASGLSNFLLGCNKVKVWKKVLKKKNRNKAKQTAKRLQKCCTLNITLSFIYIFHLSFFFFFLLLLCKKVLTSLVGGLVKIFITIWDFFFLLKLLQS